MRVEVVAGNGFEHPRIALLDRQITRGHTHRIGVALDGRLDDDLVALVEFEKPTERLTVGDAPASQPHVPDLARERCRRVPSHTGVQRFVADASDDRLAQVDRRDLEDPDGLALLGERQLGFLLSLGDVLPRLVKTGERLVALAVGDDVRAPVRPCGPATSSQQENQQQNEKDLQGRAHGRHCCVVRTRVSTRRVPATRRCRRR